jgi:hypothetical protein
MYRDSSTDTYHDSDDDLPFDMDSFFSEEEDSVESARPGNPIPKILNEDHRNKIHCTVFPETEGNPSSLLSQKRVRGVSLDGPLLRQLTSSGERWQFQKCYLPPCLLPSDSNMFSQSYIVPVSDPNMLTLLPSTQEEKIVENFQELDLLEEEASSLHLLLNNEQGDHRSTKKSRIGGTGIVSSPLKSVENIEIISQKRKKCHQHDRDDELSYFTHWDL